MKKLLTVIFLTAALVSHAQESFFRGNNNYQAPIIQLPTISATAVVSSITRYSGVSGGTITDNGGAPILASGICWSSTSNTPTISENKTTDGSSIGSFVSSITGLTAGVVYNVRAYATNRVGTTYGAVQTFTSTPTAIIPTVGSSYGGGKVAYVYQNGDPGYTPNNIPVLIAGNDVLGFTRWYNGSSIATGATSAALGSGFANTNTIVNSQGASTGGYTYAAALARNYTSGGFTDWYLPSQNELNQLYLNRVAIGGFTNAYNYFWASTEVDASNAKLQNFLSGGTVLDFAKYATGGTVRAVRTTIINPSSTPILAATSAATSLTPTSAVVGGNVTDQGMTQVSTRGFVYGTSAGSSTYSITTGAGAGTFTVTLSGLTTGTTYYVRSFATNAQGTTYGSEINFTPDFVITTVTIGSQIWTDRNLEVTKYRNGDPITYASNAAEWSAANAAGQGAYMYLLFANAEGGQTYGKLYNWYAVNDSRGLAPAGYHIPTQAEWTTLRGTQPGNGKTFKTNTTDWGASFSKSNNNLVITPDGSYFNYNGTNTTGFNCLPAGSAFPNGTNGNYGTASFWTATPDATDATKANWTYFHIYFLYDGVACCGTYEKGNGMSVRLVKD